MPSQVSQWREPIAIVSMACRLPGGIDKPLDLWDHVRAGRSSATAIPKDRFNAENFLSMDPNQKGAQAFRGAHFVKRDIKQFDHKFFGISKDTATAMDPQQKQLLEVVYECLESANISMETISKSKIGCYCAMFVADYHDMLMQDPEYLPTFIAIGTTRTMLANRISHALDLGGPSVTIDTACSGALVALHLACQALQAGECDGAVIGASNLFLSPDYALSLTRLGAIAADGQCKTFDASANGYGRGEGTNAVYVKRLSDAIRDGDNIRAVIRGTSSNSSGATPAITEPSGRAQADTILQAYAQAGINDFSETGYFECHGTGTPVGDCIELGAVGSVFAPSHKSQDALWVGSTKPNVGHSEAASGLSSLIKVVLALEKGEIPPNTNYKTPNPKIDFDGWRVRVPTSPHPWPSKSIRRASVNSLGIGGSTAHAVIEFYEPPKLTNGSANGHHEEPKMTNGSTNGHHEEPKLTNGSVNGHHEPKLTNGSVNGHHEEGEKPSFLVFTSGASRSSRDTNTSNLLEFLKTHDESRSFTEPLITALNARSQIHARPWKSYAVAQTVDGLIQQLENNALKSNSTPSSADAPRILFAFTGQGAMWSQMGKRLLEAFPVARNTLHNLEQVIGELQSSNKSAWSLIDKLTAELSQEEIDSPALAHPLSMAVQIALADVLSSWGVLPDAVVGHSGGETAAAYACGALTAKEAITVAYYRGIACENAPSGAMLACRSAPKAKELQDALERHDVQIACFNGPQNLTLAGSAEGVKNVAAELSSHGIMARAVAVTRAYHTRTMKTVVDEYIGNLKGVLHPKVGRVPMYSSVTGLELKGTEVDADYWGANLVSPVLYTDAVTLAMTQADRKLDLCVELGPHSLLSRPTSEIMKSLPDSPKVPYFATMLRNADSSQQLLSLAGDLVLNGKQLDLEQVNSARSGGKSGRLPNHLQDNIPPYAWDYSSTPWTEPRNSLEWRFRKSPRHEILGSRCRGVNPSAPTWRNKVSIEDAPWLVDHQVNGIVTFSFTTGIAMVVEAMMQEQEETKEIDWATRSFEFEDFVFSNSIILPDESPIDLFLTLIPQNDNARSDETWYDFTISSLRGDVDIRHCHGKAAVLESKDDGALLHRTSWHHMPLRVPLKSYYKTLERVGYGYGPKFQLLNEVRVRPSLSACSAKIDMKSVAQSPVPGQRYLLHPAMMDAALQTPALANRSGYFQEIDTLLLPSKMKRISIRMPAENTDIASCTTNTSPVGFGRIEGTVECYDASSRPFFVVEGLQMDRATGDDQTTLPWLRLIWRPDIGDISNVENSLQIKSLPAEKKLVNLENLVKELIPLIVENGIEKGKDLAPHLQNYHSWLLDQAELLKDRLVARHKQNGFATVQDAIQNVVSNSGIPQTVDASIVSQLAINMARIFRGEVEALAVWLENDLLYRFYEESIFTTSMNQKLLSTAELLAHKNPNMRILEIGAGTGGATTELLRGFSKAGGPNAYQSFTFTDISAGFFDKAKKKFAEWDRIDFKTLDIEKDLSQQGFTEDLEKYDLVVAANVLHATSDLPFAMKNIRSLLRDDGYLLVGELSEDLTSANFLWGPLTGWWLRPRSPGRSGPGLTMDEWRAELAADFDSVSEIEARRDQSDVDQISSTIVMVARAKPADYTPPKPLSGEKVHVVGVGSDSSTRDGIERYLGKRGVTATSSHLEELASQEWSGDWLILVDEAEGSLLASLRPEQLDALKSLLTKPIKCIWVTQKVYLDPKNTTGGLVTGFARTLRGENSQLELYTLDLTSEGEAIPNIIYHVLERIHYSHEDPISKLDYEVAEKDGQLWTCRLVQDDCLENAFGPARKMEAPVTEVVKAPHHLVVGEPGILESLTMAQDDEYSALPDGHVLVEVRAVGLDERDGWIAQGSLPATKFGRECSGIVKSCAADVNAFMPGDRVAVIGQGTFTTHYLAPSHCCRKIPDWLSFEDAAAIPTNFVTALYALTTAARVSTGQKILVINATSSQGIGLIKTATALKLDVSAAVSDKKDKSLLTKHGFCSSKIHVVPTSTSHSRATDGQAFKLVLNTRSGQYAEYSHLVANRGTYIEIGLGETLDDEFYPRPNKNVMFASIDLTDAYHDSSHDLGQLLDQVIDMVEKREIDLDMSVSVAGLHSLPSAFSTLSEGGQGKQVISLANVDDEQLIKTRPKTSSFSPHKTYIITGGLGGLGRAIAVWMASYGARNLVLATSSVSRAMQSDDLLQQLSSYGCNARVEVCDVGDLAAVERLVAAIETPVGGVIHSALRLSDRFFEDITLEDFDAVFGPKVNGTLNLHTCLLNHDLDFFVMLSSGCGVLGNEGQSNYSASSTFLDTFARYRQSLGLPASSVDLGFVEDVGNISERPEIQASLLSRGLRPITVRDVLRVVEGAIATGSPKNANLARDSSYDDFSKSQIVLSFGMIDKATAEWQSWAKDAKFGLLRSRAADNAAIDSEADGGESAVQTAVKAFRNILGRVADAAEGKEAALQPVVCSALVAKLAQVLSMKVGEIQPTRSAVQYGMDSLIAIEVRSWARYAFQIDLPINDLTNPYSIQDLAARVSRMIV